MGSLPITVGSSPPETSAEAQLAKSYDPAKLRIECARLHKRGPHCLGGYSELTAFIDRLARARDDEALRVIIAEELPGMDHAASCYASLLDQMDGLRFARTLKPFSRGWKAMLWALSSSDGCEIRAYIRKMAESSGPWVRAYCYELAIDRGWDDLVEAAWTDVEATERICEGAWADGKLSDLAREYLNRFERKRPVPPREKVAQSLP
jgi:hypothetical protein